MYCILHTRVSLPTTQLFAFGDHRQVSQQTHTMAICQIRGALALLPQQVQVSQGCVQRTLLLWLLPCVLIHVYLAGRLHAGILNTIDLIAIVPFYLELLLGSGDSSSSSRCVCVACVVCVRVYTRGGRAGLGRQ